MELFVSINTTGLDINSDDIIELSYAIVSDGIVLSSDTYKIKPRRGRNPSEISEEVLAINNTTIAELRSFSNPEEICYKFISELRTYSKKDNKLTLVGHNLKFLIDFLNNFLNMYSEYKLYSFIKFGGGFDFMYTMPLLEYILSIQLKDYKMSSICEVFGMSYIQSDTSNKLNCLLDIHNKVKLILVKAIHGDNL